MPRCFLPSLVISVLLIGVAWCEDWPCWRGPTRQGTSSEKGLPVTWSASKNIAWKTPISGSGWSSPIVCRDRVFVTATTADGVSCRVISLDRQSGKIVWDQEVFQQNPGNKREENSHATPTPVTDGELIFAIFSAGGCAALRYDGSIVWTNQEHKHISTHGLGASPILYNDLLIMPFDGSEGGDGFAVPWDNAVLLAWDKKTGQVRWQGKRGLSRHAHVSPNVWHEGNLTQIISGAGDVMQGFEPESGKLVWTVKCPGEGAVSSIVIGGGMAYMASGSGFTIYAVRPGGQGDVTKTNIVWQQTQGAPFVPSFVYVGGSLYTIHDKGLVQCIDPKSGKIIWKEHLRGTFWPSLFVADGKIYATSNQGETTVFEAGPHYKLIAHNALGETCMASIAASDGHLFIRSAEKLYCVGRR